MIPTDAWTDACVCPRCGLEACEDHLPDTAPDALTIAAAPIGKQVPAETIRWRTARELASDAPATVPWLASGFVAAGAITEVDAKVKTGKTTFTGDLGHAMVYGRPFLGRLTTPQPIVWMTEERPTSFLESLKRSHLDHSDDVHLVHWHDVKHLSWPDQMRAAVQKATIVGARLIIVDTIGQFAGLKGDSENNSGDSMQAGEPLQEAAAQGFAIWVNRHERKGGGEVGESGRGSSAFSGVADIVIQIRRSEGQSKRTVRQLHTLSRFAETPDNLVIELTDDGYIALGTEGCVAVMEAKRVLLDRLPWAAETALTLVDLLDAHEPKIKRTSAQEAITQLFDSGLIQRTGVGKRTDPYRYFKTIDVSAGTQITRSGRNV